MTSIEQLLALAQAYEAAATITRTTLSWRLFEDTNKLDAIFAGKDLQTRRFDRAVSWFSENWPTAATWPAGVRRPARKAKAKAAA